MQEIMRAASEMARLRPKTKASIAWWGRSVRPAVAGSLASRPPATAGVLTCIFRVLAAFDPPQRPP